MADEVTPAVPPDVAAQLAAIVATAERLTPLLTDLVPLVRALRTHDLSGVLGKFEAVLLDLQSVLTAPQA